MYRKFGMRADSEFDKLVDECEVEIGEGSSTVKTATVDKESTDVDNIEEDLDEAVALISQEVEPDIDEIMKEEGGAYKLRPTLASLGFSTDPQKCQEQADSNETSSNKCDVKHAVDSDSEEPLPEEVELDLNGIDDGEIDGYLLKPDEVKVRTILWTRLNAEYLKEMAEKAAKLREEEAERIKNGEPPLSDAKAKANKKRRSRKIQPQATPGQAIEVLVQRKKLSSKIDYDKLKSLMPGASSQVQPSNENTGQVKQGKEDESESKIVEKPIGEPDAKKSALANHFTGDDHDDEDEDEELEEENEEAPMSAARLLAQMSGGSYAAGGDDDYDC